MLSGWQEGHQVEQGTLSELQTLSLSGQTKLDEATSKREEKEKRPCLPTQTPWLICPGYSEEADCSVLEAAALLAEGVRASAASSSCPRLSTSAQACQ